MNKSKILIMPQLACAKRLYRQSDRGINKNKIMTYERDIVIVVIRKTSKKIIFVISKWIYKYDYS